MLASRPLGKPRAETRRRRAPVRVDRALQDLWVERLQQKDAEALRDVIGAFGERLTSVVSGLLRDRDAIEDVVQETFTKAWFRIGAFRGTSSLYTWLYRVAVNAAKDRLKRQSRRPMLRLQEKAQEDLEDASPPPLEGLERREARLRVREVLESLPPWAGSILALREIEGMSYREMAEVLGVSLGTIESRLFRARKVLRDTMQEQLRPGAGREGAEQGDAP